MGIRVPFMKSADDSDTRREVVVGLTPLGRQKAEAFSGEGPKFTILSILNEQGPSSAEELSRETGMSVQKIKHILKPLMRMGMVKKQT